MATKKETGKGTKENVENEKVKGAEKKVKEKNKSKPSTVKKTESKEDSCKKTSSGKKMKCCVHCPDYEYCQDKDVCCNYCDFYLNGKCTYGKKKGIPSLDNEIQLPDYRGDDYGIDDYEAYESVYD